MSSFFKPLLPQLVLSLALGLAVGTPAMAAPFVQLEAGSGDDLDIAGIAIGTGASTQWSRGDGAITMDWQARVQHWHSTDNSGINRNLWVAGVMPVWRWAFHAGDGLTPYLEAGIGINALSQRNIGRKFMGSNFQFNEILGGGLMFGPAQRYRVSLDLQHVSNGGLTDENPGATFATAGFQMRF